MCLKIVITRVITTQSMITKVNKSLYVTISTSLFFVSGGQYSNLSGPLGKYIIVNVHGKMFNIIMGKKWIMMKEVARVMPKAL